MVGQAHVVRSLANALDEDRLHHAFLFAGTRGVGKTTVARILAKCLNCETGVTSKPCGECGACKEIDEGRFVDLIEVDAASRSKVDETRDLMDNVQFATARGRYKVYLIDEVHMFSEKSFNALLKTLEEPPPHVKFLLATTDPQKLPITVLSRCLQFNLKRLPVDLIEAHLSHIVADEGMSAEAGALRLLSRAADGSMRDALSLLDQAIAYGGSNGLSLADVSAMLGSLDQRYLEVLLEAVATGDADGLMACVEAMADDAVDFDEALGELLSALQRLALVQRVSTSAGLEPEEVQRYRGLAERVAAEDVQLYYQIALNARRDLPFAPDPRAGFEMALLRMLTFQPAPIAGDGSGGPDPSGNRGVGAGAPARELAKADSPQPAPDPSGSKSAGSTPVADGTMTDGADDSPASVSTDTAVLGDTVVPGDIAAPGDDAALGLDVANWPRIVEGLGLSGLSRELAVNALPERFDHGVITLRLAERHSQLTAGRVLEQLRESLEHYYAEPVRLDIEIGEPRLETPAAQAGRRDAERMEQAVRAIESDPGVQAIVEQFGAEVNRDLIRPID